MHRKWFSGCIILYLLTLTRASPTLSHEDLVIRRPSYGAIFETMGRLDNSNSFWYLTVAIPMWKRRQITNHNLDICNDLPDTKEQDISAHILQLHELCSTYPEAFQAYQDENKQLIELMLNNENALRDLLPPPIQTTSSSSRKRRAVLPIIGRLSRTLFGTATTKDIKTVQQAVSTIEELVHVSTEAVIQLQDELHSYQVTANDRITNLKTAAQENTRLVNDTVQRLIQWKKEIDHLTPVLRHQAQRLDLMQKAISLLHVYRAQHTDRLRSLVQESYQRLQAVRTLIQGYLPTHFISPETLRSILTLVRRMIQTQFPNFVLTHSEVAAYYQLPITLYAHSRKYLYITLRIPVTTSDSLYNLYRLTTIPVPLSPNQLIGYTQISGHTPFLAIATTGSYFFELTLDDLSSCTGTDIRHCPRFFPSRERDALTCTAALFTDDMDIIANLCDTKLFPRAPYPCNLVRDLGDGSLFVSSIDKTWVKTCPHQSPTTIQPCNFCVMHLDCACSIRAPSFYVPPTFSNCDQEGINVTKIEHPINMLFLQSFYDYTSLLEPSGNALLPQPLNLTLPDLDLYAPTFADIYHQDDLLALDLNKTATAYKKKRTVFPTKLDKLTHDLDWVTDTSTKPLFYSSTLVNFIISIASMTLSTLLWIRSRRQGFLSLIPQSATIPTATEAATRLLPKLLDSPSDLSVTDTSTPTCLPWIIALTTTLTVTIFLCLYLIIKVCRATCRRHLPVNYNSTFIQTDLYLVLYDGRRSTSLHVMTIPRPLDELAYTLCSPINPRFINSCWKPHLSVNWAPLRLNITSPPTTPPAQHQAIFLPPTIPIPWTLKFQYKRIFRRLNACQLVLCNTSSSVILKSDPPSSLTLPKGTTDGDA